MQAPLQTVIKGKLKNEVMAYMSAHPERFDELIQLSFDISAPVRAARSTYYLSKCMHLQDDRLKQHIDTILALYPKVKDGHQRSLIVILQQMNLTEEQDAEFLDMCINTWCDNHKIPSVRCYAFKYIVDMCDKYPELKNEVEFLTEDQYLDTLTPGIKNSVNREIKKLRNIGKRSW